MNFTTFKPMFIITDEQGGFFFFFVCVPFTKNSGQMIRSDFKTEGPLPAPAPIEEKPRFLFAGKKRRDSAKSRRVHSRETGSRAVIKTSSYGS